MSKYLRELFAVIAEADTIHDAIEVITQYGNIDAVAIIIVSIAVISMRVKK
ncbi:MAG: hypothetical protein HWE34_11900 [Methylocystaceae bacterium]|nr:hypothetical protein [Methylocystaceae bacterium]